jgi:hypothetical protein
MRTTLELDDDVLEAARELARKRGATVGRIISELAQLSLATAAPPKYRNGVRLLVPKPGAPTMDMEMVNRLRDEE